MTKHVSNGTCNICGGNFSKSTMTKHLASCKQGKAVPDTSLGEQQFKKTKTFHLVIEGRDLPEYWMHIEASAYAKLADLDGFLRDTWLECCGHLSAFRIEGKTYMSDPDEEMGDEGMDVMLDEVLRPKIKFLHEYDFGTTTELVLRVVAERESEIKKKSIRVLARNDSPSITCDSCGKVATHVCSQCIYEGKGWLCDACAGTHECGEEMLLPVVNSPRVGMCGYSG
jgi:hypothetical protein